MPRIKKKKHVKQLKYKNTNNKELDNINDENNLDSENNAEIVDERHNDGLIEIGNIQSIAIAIAGFGLWYSCTGYLPDYFIYYKEFCTESSLEKCYELCITGLTNHINDTL